MRGLAAWSIRHRLLVVVIWVAMLVTSFALVNGVGTTYKDSFNLPNTESTRAYNTLTAAAPKISGDQERIVFEVPAGQNVNDPATKDAVNAMLEKVAALPRVGGVLSPYTALGAQQISKDGRIAYAVVTFDVPGFNITNKQSKQFVATAQSADSPNLKVAVSGQIAEQSNPQSAGGTGPGMLLAGLVLLLVFGSLFAMALPLVSAGIALGVAYGAIGMLTHGLTIPTFAFQLTLLIGLGVGVDYALFIVTRHRQGLIAGRDVTSSIITAVDTSGRAVLFAGIIVCIALLGMFALQISFLFGMAIAASIGVAFTMLAALTLIPALLSFIGPRVLSRRQKRKLAESGPRVIGAGGGGFWQRWATFMQKKPLIPALTAIIIVVIMTIPFFGMRLGNADQGNDPLNTTTRQAYDMLATGFGPGFNGPLQLVAVTTTPAQQDTFRSSVLKISSLPGVASVSPAEALPSKNGTTVMLATVTPTSAPQDVGTTDLISTLRKQVLPATTQGSGMTIMVGGITAVFVDFSDTIAAKLPLFVGVVVLFSFLLLAIVFRSIVIPLTAALMNLLSIGAAFGVMTAIFQHGFLGSFFGASRAGPIEAFIPVMMFAIIFGLSMDYEVFLVTRMHEEWLRTGDNATAVRNGLAATGKTITAAALIMILVFGSFIFGGQLIIKEFGVGLAVGVLVDAVLIRMAIVPSLMQLLGKANWWYPSWLERITPTISVDPEQHEEGFDIGEDAEVLSVS